MDLIRKNLTTILIVAAAIAGIVIYQSYFSGGSPQDLLTTDGQATAPGAEDFLDSLSGLQAVNLDASIFSDPVFASLVDYGINIPPEPVGRVNPFAPLPGHASTQTGSAGITSSTIKSTH